MAVITIVRQAGSGGDSVGRRVAGVVRYGVVDRAGVDEVSVRARAGLDRALTGDTDLDLNTVEAANRPMVARRSAIVRAPGQVRRSTGDARRYWNPGWKARRCAAFLRGVIRTAAEGGCVVVSGRGGNFSWERRADVLRVFIGGSVMRRSRRLAGAWSVTPELAEDLVQDSDGRRAVRTRKLFGREWTNPSGYDVVFATDHTGDDEMVATIVRAARLLDRTPSTMASAGSRAAP